jgi:hypothetical protein
MPNWNAMAPYEIIAAPFTAWLAVTGTAFPLIDVLPAAFDVAWVKIGTSGELNYKQDGVTIRHSQTVVRWRSLGDTGAGWAVRTEEALMVSLILADVSLEQYRVALNHNTVTDVAAGGEAGYRKIGLSRGPAVTSRALLVRGPSPYATNMNMQYEVPIVVHIGEPEVVYRKDEPAGLALEFEAMVDTTASTEDERFGRLVAQDAAAIS